MKGSLPKILIILMIIVALVGALSFPRRSLRSIGQTAGIALDWENGRIKATFELFDPETGETIGKKRKVVMSEGESIDECIENAEFIQGKKLFADDVSVLILNYKAKDRLLPPVLEHFCLLKNDHMDLPVFFSLEQNAGAIFSGEGAVISMDLAQSGKNLGRLVTVRDLMNGNRDYVLVKGEGRYEIIA